MLAADVDAVARTGFLAWRSARVHEDWFLQDVEDRVEAAFIKFARKPDAEVLVAVKDGVILGWGARDSREYPGDRSRAWNYVSDLWIDPAAQGKGIGFLLVSVLLDRMRADSIEVATIEVDHANAPALGLYRKLGFEEIWRGKVFSPTLGLNMTKVLLEKFLA